MASLSYPEGRFYEDDFPEVDDIVVVQVKRIVDMGAYVSLLEYDGNEGMMLLSELSKRRIRSVAKLLKVGRVEICMVLRADRDKGYVDLSKRRVDAEDAALKEESFAKAKAVHSIMRHVASSNECDLEDFCTKLSWPLYKKYGNAYDPYRRHINGEINIWNEIKFDGPGEDLSEKAEKIKEDIELDLRRKLVTQMLRMRAKVDVSCSEYEGIDAIKEALTKALEVSTEECEIKIKLIGHPTFVLTCMCKDKVMGLKKLEEAIAIVKESIESKKGIFVERQAPQVENPGQNDKKDSDSEKDDDDGDSSGSEESDVSGMGDLDEEQMKALKEAKEDSD